MVTLISGDLVLVVDPNLGGSVVSLKLGDTSILRTTPDGCNDPVACAAFPMVPFSGRIDQGVFNFAGKQVALAKNMPPEPHAIHGYGWQSRWFITEQTTTTVMLGMRYVESDWPWSFTARQYFELKNNQLDVTLSITNESNEIMPVGLGWHPFFPKHDATLTLDASKIWLNRSDKIPIDAVTQPIVNSLRYGVSVVDLDLDNAFGEVSSSIEIHWPKLALSVTIESTENYPHAVIYTPPMDDFFCVEQLAISPIVSIAIFLRKSLALDRLGLTSH